MTRGWLVLAAGVAAIVSIVAGRALMRSTPDPCPAPATSVLLQAFAAERQGVNGAGAPLQPRWSGCFDRQPPPASPVTPMQTRGALAAFEVAAQDARLSSVAAWGVALALAGNATRAISTLQDSTGSAPSATVLSDLAAAHLVRAAATGTAQDVVLALDLADRAISLDGANAGARFNAALALTALRLDDEAARAWREYLALDARSTWADTARAQLQAQRPASSTERLDRLAKDPRSDSGIEAVCAEAPQTCREYLEEVLLPAWARGSSTGDRRAESTLAIGRRLATALRGRGDDLDVDVLADLDLALSRREPRVADLVAGFIAYGEARAAFEAGGDFAPRFAEAETRLGRARSPLVGWVRANRVYAEFSQYDQARLQDVGETVSAWARDADDRRYPAVSGRLFYLAALTHGNRAEFDQAAPLYADSLSRLERTSERQHLASTSIALADALFHLGNAEQAWRWYVQAFSTIGETGSARRRYAILLNGGLWLGKVQLNRAAIRVLTAAREEAVRSATPNRIAESSLYRAKAHGRLGELEAARADLATAQPDPQRNGRWGVSERARGEYVAGVAEVEVTARPSDAITAATEALQFFEGRGFSTRVAELHLIRGRAYRNNGDLTRAAADYAAGVEVYERYRGAISSVQQRLMSQEVLWDLYEEQLVLASANPDEALALAERTRARTLLEAVRGTSGAVSPGELSGVLANEQRVLYYSLLPKELLIWVIGPGWTRFARAPVERDVIERLVSGLAAAIAHSDSDATVRAERLFDVLIGPVAAHLPPGTGVTIVPDGALNRVPFAVLHNPGTKRRFVEEHTLALAPSASMLLRFAREAVHTTPPARALVIANPASAQDASAPLAGALAEARAITSVYPTVDLLAGRDATKDRFMARAPLADVVHFGGHAISNPDFPLLAHLELARESAATGSSNLPADEIAAMRFLRTRLVVLAACQTGAGTIHHGEGVLSLARPFLIAGVPSVIASLWDIDDALTSPFVARLHEQLALGVAPDVALAETQRQFQATTPASLWSSFVLIGSANALNHKDL